MSRRIENAKSYPLGMNTGDLETSLAAFADDATYWGQEKVNDEYRRKLWGPKDEIRKYIGAWLDSLKDGITYEIVSAKEVGDGVFIEWRDAGSGEGSAYTNEGILVFEFNDDDQIKQARSYQETGPLHVLDFL
jgi:ketosteroid isomerase-like protein